MAYTDKNTIQKFMGVTISDALNDFIDELIEMAGDYVEQYCGDEKFGRRVFEAPNPDNDEERRFDGNDGVKLFVGDLRSISSMTIDGVEYTQNTDFVMYPANAINNKDCYRWIELVQPGGAVNSRSALANSFEFALGQQNVVISGKWGFSAEAPKSIKMVATKLVAALIKENMTEKDLRRIKSETLGDYNITYQDVSKVADTLGVNEILDKYKRPIFSKTLGTIVI